MPEYGWDVKYGSHALRLAFQGHEIASEGNLTLPLPKSPRHRVLAGKRSEIPHDEMSPQISELKPRVKQLLSLDRTPLPEVADHAKITAWAIDAQRRHWGWT